MSARSRARAIGAIYLLYFLTAVAGALIAPGSGGPGGLPSDAAAFAKSVTSQESQYEIGVALGLVSTAIYVALAGLFYSCCGP